MRNNKEKPLYVQGAYGVEKEIRVPTDIEYQQTQHLRIKAKWDHGLITLKEWEEHKAANDDYWFQKNKGKHKNPYYNWPDNRTKAEIDKAIEDSYTFF